jgi:uncharacterized protein YhfF
MQTKYPLTSRFFLTSGQISDQLLQQIVGGHKEAEQSISNGKPLPKVDPDTPPIRKPIDDIRVRDGWAVGG